MNTVVAPLLDARLLGYPYVSFVDEAVRPELIELQRQFSEALPGLLWLQEPRSLHITYLHLFSPDVTYNEPVEGLYREVSDTAHEVMLKVAEENGPVKCSSGRVVASPAAIIVKWEDNGWMDRLREAFTARFKLPELTKRPPTIVHTTIARYLEPVPVAQVESLARELSVTAAPIISEIDLVRESRIYLQEFEVVRRYTLQG